MGVITILSLAPLETSSEWDIPYSDKVVHGVFYAVFSALLGIYFLKAPLFRKKGAVFLSFSISAIYGIVIEVLQDTLTEDRQGEWTDVLANLLGSLLGSLIVYQVEKGLGAKK